MRIKLYETPEEIVAIAEVYNTREHKHKAVAYIRGLQDNDNSKSIIEGAYKMAIEGKKLHPFFRHIDSTIYITIPEGGYISHIATLDGIGVTWYHENMKALGYSFYRMNTQWYINHGQGIESIELESVLEVYKNIFKCSYTYAANALDKGKYFDCGSCQIYKDSFNCKNW